MSETTTEVAGGLPPDAPFETGSPQYPAGFHAPPSILLVDDEANIVQSLRRMLRPLGYQIRTAGGGAEALALLEEAPADLIVSDMRMPGMDGAALLTQARERWPDTIRVLLTGYADIQSTVAAVNQGGIYRYVSKPWNDLELQQIIRQGLELRGLASERKRLQLLSEQQNDALKALNQSLEAKVMERTGELQGAVQELVLSQEKLKKSLFTTIQVFSNLIELRAGPLAGHARRVSDLARKIAERMGLSAHEAQEVMVAALLHDIGKIGFPDAVMSMPVSKMNGEMLGLVRKHAANGALALTPLPHLRNVAAMIRSHHERWDGAGYPDGLKGEAIPLGARILAVANEYDSAQIGIQFPRKMSLEEASTYIAEGRNFRYDPAVVEAFLDLSGRPKARVRPAEQKISMLALKPGMTLARDIHSAEGVLLLATEYVLDELLVKQLHEHARSDGDFPVWVRV